MPKVSIIILTYNRAALLKNAVQSVLNQSFKDWEIVVVDDGSTDPTHVVINDFIRDGLKIKHIHHTTRQGITKSRQDALMASEGSLVAFLDDDDEWIGKDKLKKQVDYFNYHTEAVLVGGGIRMELRIKNYELRMRPQSDAQIRSTMLFRNNFFTSTVMVRRGKLIEAGGFILRYFDCAEDYDAWLRIGRLGSMYNFQEVFALYRNSGYNRGKFLIFLRKQVELIRQNKRFYPHYLLARIILWVRMII